MINTNDVIQYVENKNHIKLEYLQKRFLHNLVRGVKTRVPRCFGKTILVNGYCDYLKNVYDKIYSPEFESWDETFGIADVIAQSTRYRKDHLRNSATQNPEMFEAEYAHNALDFIKRCDDEDKRPYPFNCNV